jgi:hypothetical protein
LIPEKYPPNCGSGDPRKPFGRIHLYGRHEFVQGFLIAPFLEQAIALIQMSNGGVRRLCRHSRSAARL